MNLTWHIVKKDLRAMRWPLGFWFLCIVAKLGVGMMLLNATGEEGPEWFRQMDILAKGLAAGELLSFVLVGALVQEDLMVGTTAFWMTRPISGGRLLSAKLLTIAGVFLAAPVVVTLPWWLGCDYGSGEIAWAAAETVAVHAIVVLAALLWSAVTDGLGRFLMWTLVTLVSVPMLTGIIGYYFLRGRMGPTSEVVSTRFVMLIILVVVSTAVVLVHQYLTRHTWRSIGIIGGMMGLTVLTLAFWPWAWNIDAKIQGYLIRRAQGEWPVAAEPAGLTFKLRSAEFAARKDRANRPGTLNLQLRVEGLASGQAIASYPSEHSWRWPDGTAEQGYGIGRASLNSLGRGQAMAFAQGAPAAGALPGDSFSLVSFVPSVTMQKVRAQPPAYTAQARLRLMKFAGITPVPLQAGAWQTKGLVGERLAAVEKLGDQLHVTFMRHVPSFWVDIVGGGRMAPDGDFSRYFVVNRRNGWTDDGRSLNTRTTRIGTVEIIWQTLYYHASPKAGSGRPVLEAINALDDAELIKVTYAEEARFTHEFQLTPDEIARANP